MGRLRVLNFNESLKYVDFNTKIGLGLEFLLVWNVLAYYEDLPKKFYKFCPCCRVSMAVTKCRSRTWDMLFRGTEKESEKLGAGAALSLDSSVLWASFITLFLIANEAHLKKLECLSLACFFTTKSNICGRYSG